MQRGSHRIRVDTDAQRRSRDTSHDASREEKMKRVTTTYVKVINERIITISCHTKQTIEEIKKKESK